MGKRRSGRKGYKPIEGAEHRIHRRRKNDSTTEWTRAAKAGKGTEYDSLCHRYLREIGAFRRDDDASLAANAAASVSAVAASGAAASTASSTCRATLSVALLLGGRVGVELMIESFWMLDGGRIGISSKLIWERATMISSMTRMARILFSSSGSSRPKPRRHGRQRALVVAVVARAAATADKYIFKVEVD